DHELGRRARHEQLRAARLRAHFVEIAAHAIAGANGFARDGLVARDVGFGIAAEIEIDAAALDALDHTRDQFAHAILVRLDDLCAFRLAHALHDHLLGGLCGDTAEFGILDLFFDEFADLDVRACFDGVHHSDLPVRRFHHDVVGNDLPAAEGF